MFVTFEGLDGSGKTTQVELLRKLLEAEGRTVVTTREPGGTPLGEQVREILLHGEAEIVPWAEAAMFAAVRSQLVEHVIAPALEAGYDVLCDRYIDSSLAYQGIARGLGVDRVLELNLQATRGLLPDRTILMLVDLEEAGARTGGERDRIERDRDFIARVDRAYRELAELFPRRILTADGSQDPNQLARLIRGQLRDLS
ncbi:MAG TPA: dTMP kinase [Gaiellaceae bacterium]|jgi:dTMP kinase|nr:dTMP kinase [Gaiellaceae bacterium]